MKDKINTILKNIKKLDKRTKKTAVYTVAVLFAIIFAIYPATNSFFKKDNDNSLVFNSNFNKTISDYELGVALNKSASDIDTIHITLTLTRDQKYKNENEHYIIEGFSSLSNSETVTCKVVPNSKSDNLDITAENTGKDKIYNISFNSTSASVPETGSIDISCDVRKNIGQKEDINVLIKVYEAVGKETKFLYQSAIYDQDYLEYDGLYRPADPNKTIYFKDENGVDLTDAQVYDAFLAIIRDYHFKINDFAVNYNVPLYYFEDYINDYGTLDSNDTGITRDNARTMLLSDDFSPLLGIARYIMNDETGNNIIGYSFELDENLTGYVKNYKFYKNFDNVINSNKFLYLSSTNSNNISLAIQKTLENYIYPDKTTSVTINGNTYTNAELVYEYIKSNIEANNGGIYSVDNLKTILGISYELGSANDQYPYLKLDYKILDYAYNYLSSSNEFRITHYPSQNAMRTVFKEGIKKYNNSELETLLTNKINDATSALYKAVTCTSNCSEYTETILVGSDTYEIVVKPNTGYNIIEVNKVSDPTPVEENIKIPHTTASDMIDDLKDKIANLKTNTKYKDVIEIINANIGDANSHFYKSIISVENTPNDTEVYYVNGKYYSITVNHNKTDNYNEIIAEEITLDEALALTTTSTLPEALIKDAKDANSKLNKYITCTNNCDNYNDIYYDGTSYYHVKTTDSTNYKKIESIVKNDIKTTMSSVYNSDLVDSIMASLSQSSSYLAAAINTIYTPDESRDPYYELHYNEYQSDDSTTNTEFALFKVDHKDGANVISSTSLIKNGTDNELASSIKELADYTYNDTLDGIARVNWVSKKEKTSLFEDSAENSLFDKITKELQKNYSGTTVTKDPKSQVNDTYDRGIYTIEIPE